MLDGTWRTTKRHYFSKDGAFGSKESICGQVSDSEIRLDCQVCKKMLESGKHRQMRIKEGKDE